MRLQLPTNPVEPLQRGSVRILRSRTVREHTRGCTGDRHRAADAMLPFPVYAGLQRSRTPPAPRRLILPTLPDARAWSGTRSPHWYSFEPTDGPGTETASSRARSGRSGSPPSPLAAKPRGSARAPLLVFARFAHSGPRTGTRPQSVGALLVLLPAQGGERSVATVSGKYDCGAAPRGRGTGRDVGRSRGGWAVQPRVGGNGALGISARWS